MTTADRSKVAAGSITVFFALMLSIMVAFICTSIESVRMACARAQIAIAMDVGMYSLFAQYDPYLLDRYDLFFLDGGYGNGSLNLSGAYHTIIDYMEPILSQNYQNLKVATGGITGYSLATDQNGQVFHTQAVRYMRDTLGSQGIQLLLGKIQEETQEVEYQQDMYKAAEENNSMEDYDQMIQQAETEQQLADEQAALEGNLTEEETMSETELPEEPVENPIDVIRQIQAMDILDLVLPDASQVSVKGVEHGQLLSHRELQKGMGVTTAGILEEAFADDLLFQEFILQKCSSFLQADEQAALAYQIEYIIGGKNNDRDNLKAMVHRLLLIREGVNFVYLLSDSVKRAQAAALAAAIAAAMALPVVTGMVEMVLLLCWSFAESVLDVRTLVCGEKVPLLKNQSNWQIALENLPDLLSGLDSLRKTDSQGMDYKDYMRTLLFLESSSKKLIGCMNMVEIAVRGQEGKENFRLDSCITAMEAEIEVEANGRKTYSVLRQYGYEW